MGDGAVTEDEDAEERRRRKHGAEGTGKIEKRKRRRSRMNAIIAMEPERSSRSNFDLRKEERRRAQGPELAWGSVQSSHAKCELVLASWNPQKLREMMEISRVLNIRVRKAEEEGVARGPVTPADLVEDSKLKAMHVMRKTGKAAMADCAVLKVPVLRDAPGFE
ncbi:hypothetical protein GUITHDRAFT_148259, partial [Guillardia theta CCMP2712]